MNKELVNSYCSLSSIREDIIASLSILKSLWQDKRIVSAVNNVNSPLTMPLKSRNLPLTASHKFPRRLVA